MTERESQENLLANLLAMPDATTAARAHSYDTPHELTARDERSLLRAANNVGTPTLAPFDAAPVPGEETAKSFANELIDVVRHYPIPTLLAGAGLAYMLTRRRR